MSVPLKLRGWAARYGISNSALHELFALMGTFPPEAERAQPSGRSESFSQSQVRLEAAKAGVHLWRNNVGALPNPETGVPVRFGLANDSPQLNKVLKSSDLIGWRPVIITHAMAGATIAQFVSRECKEPGWVWSATPREQAQLRWIELVNMHGGDAAFATGPGNL